MPGTVICVRFDDTALAGLDALCRALGNVTHSWAIRRAVSRCLMQSSGWRVDKEKPIAYDISNRPEPPSGDRSEPDVVPPPAASGLPVPDPSIDHEALAELAHPDPDELRVHTLSRPVQRRIAAQKGEPVPEISIDFSDPTEDMSANELEEWMDKVMAGKG